MIEVSQMKQHDNDRSGSLAKKGPVAFFSLRFLLAGGLIALFFSINPLAFASDIFTQKTEQENNLRNKISNGISSILKPNEYVVNVTISIEDDTESVERRAKQKAALKEAEEKAARELEEKKKEEEKQREKQAKDAANPFVRNAQEYDNGENALFIDKFDLPFPIQLGGQTEDEKNKNEPSLREILGQINLNQESVSIMDRIKNVTVEVLIDKSVSPLRQDMVKDLLQRIVTPIAAVTPQVSYASIGLIPPDEANAKREEEEARLAKLKLELEEAKKAAERVEENPVLKMIREFKIPIAIVLFALLIGFLGFALLGRMIQFGNKFLTTLDEAFTKTPAQQAAAHAPTGAGGEGVGGMLAGQLSMSGGTISLDDDVPLVGFDRFMSLLKSSPNEALLLIRRWINQQAEGSTQALTIIIKKSSTDDLLYIFDNLSVTERAQWKKNLVTDMDKNNLRLGDTFIEAQIMEDIILPPPTLDKESKKILSRITPQECARILRDDFEIGSILLNVLPTDFIADTYELIDQETALLLSDYGLNYTDGLLNEKREELTKLLSTLDTKQKSVYAPFLDKIVDMIPYVGLEKERALFDSLYRNGKVEILKEVARENFPGELINRLSEDVVRKILMKYKRDQRVEFLLSLDDAEREFYLSVFGDKNSKMRSFIEADMELILENESKVSTIKSFKEKIGRAFIQFFRKELSIDESASPEIDRIIDDWIGEKAQQGQTTSTTLDVRNAA
ncbi:MAG: hypothetical protein A2504_09005 [Bdellovibrionales bacterium RIFOXYD12_FULL_39_22]|nr:MAG: hypothetical protein A2385_13520 [Bdellovibrionales bacterium RIFOXYB1_FULL_39_21]OFZ40892.1 MAG: hypothetical protein A2485_16225 [Bdellovibrionales bacterium RIFOXYC12_FULL_39_17]OFZ44764.1 MAG: hypothetical protein A2404_10895 [Bdellovibrionales bacterium RIFOXYC1_FULL_39_130]OFZ74216.1 MAG: hypothetical protein A2560_03560 [Bdellovibrionales bacterium RIFOXYD1_FULL_39_84]OFZ92096.1 MAG: hypothetical protein A2504_09005 [Bdellovibrionales bacterium RIFOXYD12_FULL_39_22]